MELTSRGRPKKAELAIFKIVVHIEGSGRIASISSVAELSGLAVIFITLLTVVESVGKDSICLKMVLTLEFGMAGYSRVVEKNCFSGVIQCCFIEIKYIIFFDDINQF